MRTRLLRARTITRAELIDIARCFHKDEEWNRVFSEDETVELLGNELLGLAVDIPPERTPITIYSLYLGGCDAPLFVQVREGENRDLYEGGAGKLLRPRSWVPLISGQRKN